MLKRKWYWALAAFIVLCLSNFILFRPKPQLEPIKTYKMVTPAPKRGTTEASTEKAEITTQHDHDHGHSHDHTDDAVSHSHTVETNTNGDRYDWRGDSAFDIPFSKANPWTNLKIQQTAITVSDSEASENYVPQDWYLTEDPELYAEYFRSQLITQFGDRPEVHILADTTLKIRQNIPLTHEQYIADLEAQYTLWSDERTLQALEKAKSESGEHYVMFSEDSE